jgi:hypothetical protein
MLIKFNNSLIFPFSCNNFHYNQHYSTIIQLVNNHDYPENYLFCVSSDSLYISFSIHQNHFFFIKINDSKFYLSPNHTRILPKHIIILNNKYKLTFINFMNTLNLYINFNNSLILNSLKFYPLP